MQVKSRKTTKTHLIFDQLHQDLINNIYAPGERLPMSMLKDRYQVGGSPLRESLSRLAAQGLLEIEEQCGFRVKPLSIIELHDIYMAREIIDLAALDRAIKLGDDRWEAEVVASAHRLAKYIDPSTQLGKIDVIEWERRQKDFINSIVKGSRSPWLLKLHDMLYDQAARYRMLCLQKHYDDKKILNAVIAENQLLVEAILARDIKSARKNFIDAWHNTIEVITKILQESN